MGKYDSKEKTRKRRIEKLKESVLECLIVLLGVVVVTLFGLPDDLFDGQDAYAIGLLVLFLISLAGSVIHKLIRKNKNKEK